MAFKTYNRLLYAKLESTEGTVNVPNDTAGYIETIEPTFTVTNRAYERNPTRLSITQPPMIVPGKGIAGGASATAPSATVEFTFGVELSGSGTDTTAPAWSPLLEACGMAPHTVAKVAIDTPASLAATPCLLNAESLADGSGISTFAAGATFGRCVGDTFRDDDLYYVKTGSETVADGFTICGEITNGSPRFDADGASVDDSGTAWVFNPVTTALGGGDDSSLTIRLVYDNAGSSIEAVGCRGTVEFAFVSGDAVRMNFTFTGRLNGWETSATGMGSPSATTPNVPPAFIGSQVGIGESTYASTGAAAITSSIFNSMTITLGNEVTVRENVAADSGYDVAYITGRAPTMTFNPDAVDESTYGFWDRFLSGESSRINLTVGTATGNQFLFRMPAVQFSGIADGNRDEVFIYDATANLTGGDYGSSVQQAVDESTATATVQTDARLGTNNEFVFFQL